MDQKTHYLIEIPPRTKGIYLIMNLIWKKAYVGLAQNLANRTLDHFKAICCTVDGEGCIADNQGDEVNMSWLDNKNLLKEEHRQFLHIPICIKDKKLTDEELRNTETAYICMVRDSGFELYNVAKSKETKWTLDVVKDKVDCEALLQKLNDKLNSIVGYDLESLGKMEENGKEVNEIWSDLTEKNDRKYHHSIKTWENPDLGRFMLTKHSPSQRYCENSQKYKEIVGQLDSFCISKGKMDDIFKRPSDPDDFHFPVMSIKSNELRELLRNKIVISNFGTHNGESPYEILLKKAMDIERFGYTYWAYKKDMEREVLESIKYVQATGKEHPPAYILLKTTKSDNSGGTNPRPDLMAQKAKETILRENEAKRRKNTTDIKHAYYDYDTSRWVLFPKDMSAVTSPRGNGKFESKSVAFKISNFWLCEENFDINNEEKIVALTLTESGKTGSLPSFPVKFLDDSDNSFFDQNLPVNDETQVIIAQLTYPYVVPISHVPDMELFFECWDNDENPIYLETEGNDITDNTPISKVLITRQIVDKNGKRKMFANMYQCKNGVTVLYSDFISHYYDEAWTELFKDPVTYSMTDSLVYQINKERHTVPCQKIILKQGRDEHYRFVRNINFDSKSNQKVDTLLLKGKDADSSQSLFRFYPDSPRVLIQPRSGKDTEISSAIVLFPEKNINKAWVIHPKGHTIDDLFFDDNTALWAECKRGILAKEEDGYEGTYCLEENPESRKEQLRITANGHEDIVVDLSEMYQQPDTSKLLYPDSKSYGYYRLPQKDGVPYLIRYRERKVGKILLPPFIPYTS